MLPERVVDQLTNGRHRIDLKKAEKFARGEHYSRSSIAEYEYSPDVVEHWLRYYWSWLVSVRRVNELYEDIWVDLNSAMDSLTGDTRIAVDLLVDGFATNGQYKEIGRRMGLKSPVVRELLQQAFKDIAAYLGYRKDEA